MQRLKTRRLSLLSRDYLTYRALWPAIGLAVDEALKRCAGAALPLTVVDIGCGQKPYADMFGSAHYIGLDFGATGACPDVIADALALPVADGIADIVFSTQVIEHVTDPQRMLGECCRILRPGGVLVLTGPFYWPLHEEPHDYFRFTVHGFAHLLRAQGLTEIRVSPDTGSLTQLAVAFVELLPRWGRPLLPLINLATPWLQACSSDRRCTLNVVALGSKPRVG